MQSWVNGSAYQRRTLEEQEVSFVFSYSASPPADQEVDVHDLQKVAELSNGKVDLTFGSALDIFGGKGVTLDELVAWNKRQGAEEQ